MSIRPYRIAAAVLLCCTWVAEAAATNYYVDSGSTAAGVPNGSYNAPFKTIAQVNAQPMGAGDAVYFKCGRSWPGAGETLTTLDVRSGVTYDSYSAQNTFGCVSPKPVLRGSVTAGTAGWTGPESAAKKIYWTTVPAGLQITQVIHNDGRLPRARHPNPARSLEEGSEYGAGSRYFRMGSRSATELPVGSAPVQIKLGRSIADIVGATAFVRVTDYAVAEYSIGAVNTSNDAAALDLPAEPWRDATYGFNGIGQEMGGYWLENKRWMLDQPGEWFHDTSTNKLYVWLPSGTAPAAGSVRIAAYSPGAPNVVRAHDVSNFTIKNLSLRDASHNAVTLWKAAGPLQFTINGVEVHNAGRHGFYFNGPGNSSVAAATTTRPVMSNLTVRDTLGDGIQINGLIAEVSNSTFERIGLDRFSLSAIAANNTAKGAGGMGSLISQNTFTDVGSRAVTFSLGATVQRNRVTRACTQMNDCGALYTNGNFVNVATTVDGMPVKGVLDAVVNNNFVADVPFNRHGTYGLTPVDLVSGIYLDDYAAKVTVQANHVKQAGYGTYLHGTRKTTFSDNTMEANRLAGLLIAPTGDDATYSAARANAITNNNLLATLPGTLAVIQEQNRHSTEQPGTYTGNRYASTVPSAFRVVAPDPGSQFASLPSLPVLRRDLTFYEWQNLGGGWGEVASTPNASDGAAATWPANWDSIYYRLPQRVFGGALVSHTVRDGGFSNTASPQWSSGAGTAVQYVPASGVPAGTCKQGSCLQMSAVCTAGVCGAFKQNGRAFLSAFANGAGFPVSKGDKFLVVVNARASNPAGASEDPTAIGDFIMPMLINKSDFSGLNQWGRFTVVNDGWRTYHITLEALRDSPDATLEIDAGSNGAIYLDTVYLYKITENWNTDANAVHVVTNPTGSFVTSSSAVVCPVLEPHQESGQFRELRTNTLFTCGLMGMQAYSTRVFTYRASGQQDADWDRIPDNALDQCDNSARQGAAMHSLVDGCEPN